MFDLYGLTAAMRAIVMGKGASSRTTTPDGRRARRRGVSGRRLVPLAVRLWYNVRHENERLHTIRKASVMTFEELKKIVEGGETLPIAHDVQ